MNKRKAGQGLYVRLLIRSRLRTEMVERFAQVTGAELGQAKARDQVEPQVSLTGDELHEVMKELWPYLTKQRQMEYKRARVRANESKLTPAEMLEEEARVERNKAESAKRNRDRHAEVQAQKLATPMKSRLSRRRGK